jgi:hypothetical protein
MFSNLLKTSVVFKAIQNVPVASGEGRNIPEPRYLIMGMIVMTS